MITSSDIIKKSDSTLHDLYKLGSPILNSPSTEILKARHLPTGEKRAVRICPKCSIQSPESLSQILSEITALSRTIHPNVVNLYDFYQDRSNYYIITERPVGGDLLSSLLSKDAISEATCANYMRQLFSVLAHLRSLNIAHRNIKLETLLLSSGSADSLKLVSFKRCKVFTPGTPATERVGTPLYMAPEVIRGCYDCSCDTWSAGVAMHILLTGHAPFIGKSAERVFRAIAEDNLDMETQVCSRVSEEAKDLLRRILDKDPSTRIRPEEVLEHPWFRIASPLAPSREVAARYVANLSSFKSKQTCKRCIYRYMSQSFIMTSERDEILTLFRSLDVNGNGVLSKKELKEGFIRLFGNRIKNIDAELDKMIAEVDLDGPGEISYEEFTLAAIGKQRLMERKRLEEVFRSLDIDHNGTIEIEELRAVLSRFRIDDATLQKFLSDCDTNNDGHIDIEEFTMNMLGK